jgi:hypothetical protein
MKFANATNLDRKSGGAQGRDLLFHFRAKRMCREHIASRFRFSTTQTAGPSGFSSGSHADTKALIAVAFYGPPEAVPSS